MISLTSEIATEIGPSLLLPTSSSLALLVPAALAAHVRQPVLAATLLGAALFSLLEIHSSNDAAGAVQAAAHVCSHLSVIQVALALLGPADPEIDPASSILGIGKAAAHSQLRSLGTLVGCGVVLFAEWFSRHHWAPQDFGRISVLVDQVLISMGFILFWFCTARRRTMASKVSLHVRFWQRLLYLALPVVVLVVLAAVQSANPSSLALQALSRITAAITAATGIWLTFCTCRLEVDMSTSSPHIAQWLLFGYAAILVPAVVLTLAGEAWEHTWRWPTLSMAATSKIGSFVLTAAALPLAAAVLIVMSLIESVPPARSPPGVLAAMGLKLPMLKELHGVACHLGRLSVLFGFATCIFIEKGKLGQQLHTGCTFVMFASYWGFVVLSALGSDLKSSFGKARAAIATCILMGMGIHLLLFLFANGFVTTRFGIPPALTITYFLSEYIMLGLVVVYPVTWFEDVENWQDRCVGPMGQFAKN